MPKPIDDWYAQGFRYVQARDVFGGDDFLVSYVEQVIMDTCRTRDNYGNGMVEINGLFYREDQGMWVRKH